MIVSSDGKSRSLSFSFPDFITVGCASVPLSDSVKSLGQLVLHLIAIWQWKPMSPIWYAQLTLNSIALVPPINHLLSTDATKTLVSAFVLSRLDYCNSFLFGCPQYLLNKLQKVYNNAAHLVLRVSKMDHISPHFASLHWLPIDSQIQYKLTSHCYNCLSSAAPNYLTELLRIYKPTCLLRSSSDTSILCIPTVRTHSLGQRSFSYAAPTVWNTLPYEIRSSNTISSFRSSLKTYLFQQSYWLCACWGGGEKRGGGGERERENEWFITKCESFSPLILFHVMGLELRRRKGTEKNTTLLLSL